MVKILQGDWIEMLKTLESESVHCVVTSPPYWGLRDYGTAQWEGGEASCEHRKSELRRGVNLAASAASTRGGAKKIAGVGWIPYSEVCDKCGARRIDQQLGLEPTPEEYVRKLVAGFREVRRVLRKDGTLWLNLGDSYYGSWANYAGGERGAGKQRPIIKGSHAQNPVWQGLEEYRPPASFPHDLLKPKDLVGIPWRVAFALQADGWWLRSDIIWSKPNPMPESVTDRPTKAHEYLFLLTKSADYYYDEDAIKEETIKGGANSVRRNNSPADKRMESSVNGRFGDRGNEPAKAGRNKRSVWTIATQPFPEAHFATFPEDLVKPCILAGTSAKGVCAKCGAPFVRVVEGERVMRHELPHDHPDYRPGRYTVKSDGSDDYAKGGGQAFRFNETIGWEPSCDHFTEPLDENNPAIVRSVVLDPFAGSGTVGLVARMNHCDFIGIELNPEYCRMAERRLGQEVFAFDSTVQKADSPV